MSNVTPILLLGACWLATAAPAHASVHRDLSPETLQHATQQLSKGGPAAKLLVAPGAGSIGYVTGGRGASFLTERLYLGGAGYGGLSSAGGLAYGGFVAGYEQPIGARQAIDLSVLLGGGGHSSGGGYAMEPELSVSHRFGGGYVGALTVSYLHAPAMPTISGAMVGLRLDFKHLSLSLPVDE